MINQEPISNEPCKNSTLQSFKSAFVVPIGFKCIICKDNIVKVADLYDLIDFGDRGKIYPKKVRFLNMYLKGYTLTIVLLDLKAGEMLTRSHRIDNDICNWVLMDVDVFNPKTDKKEIINY